MEKIQGRGSHGRRTPSLSTLGQILATHLAADPALLIDGHFRSVEHQRALAGDAAAGWVRFI